MFGAREVKEKREQCEFASRMRSSAEKQKHPGRIFMEWTNKEMIDFQRWVRILAVKRNLVNFALLFCVCLVRLFVYCSDQIKCLTTDFFVTRLRCQFWPLNVNIVVQD